MHRRHNFNALLPRWFSSSDALALSHSKHITGDTTMTSLCRAESYTRIPSSRERRSCTMASDICSAFVLLEAEMKKIFALLWAFSLGRQASEQHHTSNLFHFLERLPLVSSEYRKIGAKTTGRPALVDFLGCSTIKVSYSCNDIIFKICNYHAQESDLTAQTL